MLRKLFQNLSFAFTGGAFGALLMCTLMWVLGDKGIPQSVGVNWVPHLSLHWLYPQLIWGGCLGVLFLLPWFGSTLAKQIAILTLIPTALQLFWFLPEAGHGYVGVNLGALTPLFVLGYSLVWSIGTGVWLKVCR